MAIHAHTYRPRTYIPSVAANRYTQTWSKHIHTDMDTVGPRQRNIPPGVGFFAPSAATHEPIAWCTRRRGDESVSKRAGDAFTCICRQNACPTEKKLGGGARCTDCTHTCSQPCHTSQANTPASQSFCPPGSTYPCLPSSLCSESRGKLKVRMARIVG